MPTELWVAILIGTSMSFWVIGFLIGGACEERASQIQAVKAGVGEWFVTDDGKKSFKFKYFPIIK